LVGEEVRAARAVDLQPVVELLDAVFHLGPHAIDPFVQMPRGTFQVRNDKTLTRRSA
jgi:hypothetical protein